MPNIITESEIEQIALDILKEELGYEVCFGADLSEGDTTERSRSGLVLVKCVAQLILP